MKIYLMILLLYLAGYVPIHLGAGRRLKSVLGLPYLLCMALMLLALARAPNALALYLAIIVIFVVTVRSREDALCRFVSMISLIPAINWPFSVGPFYLGTFLTTLPFSIALLIAMAIHPDRQRATAARRGFRVEDALVIAIFVIFTDSFTRGGPLTGYVRQIIVSGVSYLLPYYLFRVNVRTPERLQLMIACIAVAAMSIALVGLYETRAGWAMFDAFTHRYGANGSAASVYRRGAYLRASASLGLPLMFAFFFVMATIAMACSRALFVKPLIWRGCVVFLLLATVAAQSRGALVAAVPAFLVLLAARRRFAAAAGLLAVSGVGGVALFAFSGRSSAISSFLGNTQTMQGGYHDYRELLLHRGLQEGAKHPFIGQPLKQAIAALDDIKQGEQIVDLVNTYLNIYLTSGLLGLGTFVILCALMIRKLVARAPRGADQEAIRSSRAFLLASIVATLTSIATTSFVERLPFYLLMLCAGAGFVSSVLIRKRPAGAGGSRGGAAPVLAGAS